MVFSVAYRAAHEGPKGEASLVIPIRRVKTPCRVPYEKFGRPADAATKIARQLPVAIVSVRASWTR